MIDQLLPIWPLWTYALLVTALFSIGIMIFKIAEERKIQSLGERAPWVSKLPFGEF
jgi:hypothetical protein